MIVKLHTHTHTHAYARTRTHTRVWCAWLCTYTTWDRGCLLLTFTSVILQNNPWTSQTLPLLNLLTGPVDSLVCRQHRQLQSARRLSEVRARQVRAGHGSCDRTSSILIIFNLFNDILILGHADKFSNTHLQKKKIILTNGTLGIKGQRVRCSSSLRPTPARACLFILIS